MVDGADVLRHFTCFDEVGAPLLQKSGVEATTHLPCCPFNTFFRRIFWRWPDDGRVQPAGQQHAVKVRPT